MSEIPVILSSDDPLPGVCTLTLNRPNTRNALTRQMLELLKKAIFDINGDDNCRAVLLTGSGATFCGGADLGWMREGGSLSEEENFRDAFLLADVLEGLALLPVPVLARVTGGAYGGGVGLCCVSDIVIAAEDTQFRLSEVRLGVIPATIAPYVITAIGERSFKYLTFTAQQFTAKEAFAYGFVTEVVPIDLLEKKVEVVLTDILKGGPQGVRRSKELVRALKLCDQARVKEYTARLLAQVRSTDEAKEGINAFFEKREPVWVKCR